MSNATMRALLLTSVASSFRAPGTGVGGGQTLEADFQRAYSVVSRRSISRLNVDQQHIYVAWNHYATDQLNARTQRAYAIVEI